MDKMYEIVHRVSMVAILYTFGIIVSTIFLSVKTTEAPAPPVAPAPPAPASATPAPAPASPATAPASPPAGAPAPFKFDKYHKTDDIYNFLKSLPAKSKFVSVQSIGKTEQGRDILLTIISSGIENAPVIWLDARKPSHKIREQTFRFNVPLYLSVPAVKLNEYGTTLDIHAKERIASATLLYITNKLIEKREILDAKLLQFDLYIVILVNPDGYEFTIVQDILSWRKNRSHNNMIKFCRGADLNRNWSYHWGGAMSSDDPCLDYYKGSSPFSELETKAVSEFIMKDSFNKRIKAYLTLHSYAQYILYPWSCTTEAPTDVDELDRVAKIMAEAIRINSGKKYKVGSSSKLTYISSGESLDWAKAEAEIPYTYTIELRDDGEFGFDLPADQIIPSGEEIFAAFEALAKEIKI